MSKGGWLTPREAGARDGCSDQTILARIRSGEFADNDVQVRPAGKRPRYLVHERALKRSAARADVPEWESPSADSPSSLDELSEAALLRDELARVRRHLTDLTAERDRLRAEVVKLKDVGLHLTRATEAFLLPDTLND